MKLLDNKWNVIFVCLSALLAWVTCIDLFLNWLRLSDLYLLKALFFSCICAPIFEELIFRHIPLQTAKLIYDPSTAKGLKLTMLTVMMSSFIFGWGHGHGWNSVLIQGVCGVVFSYIYLKNNYSYWSAVLAHSIYNLIWTLVESNKYSI